MQNLNSIDSDKKSRLSLQLWRDYLELTKPKVVLLMLITAVAGMYLATHETLALSFVLITLIGLALGMGGAAAVNHVVDQQADRLMSRTQQRPIATGKISNIKALVFASTLCVCSFFILTRYANLLTAWLTIGGIVGYAVVYTLYLKRATPQNIVIGGLAGALPPLLGWTAVTNSIHPHALLLVLIIFVWTPPHFWALAVHRKAEYAKANIPMLPVTHGIEFTKNSIWLYTILLTVVSLLPFITKMSGLLYLSGAVVLNIVYLFYSGLLKWQQHRWHNIAMKNFGYSIVYLFALFILLLVDHYV